MTDVVSRVYDVATQSAETVQQQGNRLVATLPGPVAGKVEPVWSAVSRRPLILVAGIGALLGALVTCLINCKR
jgi:hypothetical protein